MQDGLPIDVILDRGVLWFDGRVVEAFGFSLYDHTVRSHVATIERVDIDRGGRFSDPSVTFNPGRVGRPITAYYRSDQAPDVERLVEAVRAAAALLSA